MEFLSYQNRFPSEPNGLHRKNEPSYRFTDYSSLYPSTNGGLDSFSYADYYDSYASGASSMAPSRQGRSVDYRRNSLESGPPFLRYSANAHFSTSLFDDSFFPAGSRSRDADMVPTDNFLFESPGLAPTNEVSTLPPATASLSKRTPPPLPPRSYLGGDGRDAYSLVLPSTHSASTSSMLGNASKPVSGYWSRTITPFADPAEPAAGAQSGTQLTASAVPFVGSQSRAVESSAGETATEGEASRPVEEKKKGDGDDVDIAKLYSGEETRSAVMIRNIPNRFSKEEMCEILNEFVEGKFSIMNMPLDSKTHRNLGYCFIQFNSIPDLIEAYNHVGVEERVGNVVARQELAQVRVYEEMPILLRQDSERSEYCDDRGCGEGNQISLEAVFICFSVGGCFLQCLFYNAVFEQGRHGVLRLKVDSTTWILSRPTEAQYQQALELGELLARNHFTIISTYRIPNCCLTF